MKNRSLANKPVQHLSVGGRCGGIVFHSRFSLWRHRNVFDLDLKEGGTEDSLTYLTVTQPSL